MEPKIEIDGYKVIEEYLLTKGEHVVYKDMTVLFKPLIEFGLIVYSKKVNATNKLAMKFDLEKFFMRRNAAKFEGHYLESVRVPKGLYDKVKALNDQFRNDDNSKL